MGGFENTITPPASPLQKLVRVRHEFRIGARAEFVQIKALPFSFGSHAVREEAIDEPIETVTQGQNQPQQCSYSRQLGQPLPGIGNPRGASKAVGGVQNRRCEAAQ